MFPVKRLSNLIRCSNTLIHHLSSGHRTPQPIIQPLSEGNSVLPLQRTDEQKIHVSTRALNDSSDKLYELRTYTIKPKHFREFIDLTEEKYHVRTRHSKLLGYWMCEYGGLNQVIHLWEYDGYQHRRDIRAKLAADQEWQNEYVKKAAPMWVKQTNLTAILFPWSKLLEPTNPGVYELQEFQMYGYADAWEKRLKAAVEVKVANLKPCNSVLLGVFSIVFGLHNAVITLWQHESFDKLAKVRKEVLNNEINKSIMNAFYHEVRVAYCKGMLPLKVSPMK